MQGGNRMFHGIGGGPELTVVVKNMEMGVG